MVQLAGLGSLTQLDDELVMHVLGNLGARQLAILANVSKAMMCFANHEGLWKALTIEASHVHPGSTPLA